MNSDPVALIQGQLFYNHGSVIASVGYDSALNLATVGPYLKSVDYTSLKPLSNNYLVRTGSGSSSHVALIDETAVARIIDLNSNWVAYLNGQNSDVLNDVAQGSDAENMINLYQGYQIVFHRLALGDIYVNGSNVYVLAQPYYTVLKEGQSATVNDVFLYTLVKQDDTLVVSGIEQVQVPLS